VPAAVRTLTQRQLLLALLERQLLLERARLSIPKVLERTWAQMSSAMRAATRPAAPGSIGR
jgi:hypothetical protein